MLPDIENAEKKKANFTTETQRTLSSGVSRKTLVLFIVLSTSRGGLNL